MLKWIILIVAGYLLFRLVTGDKKKKMADKQKQQENLAATGEMVRDPLCGTFVNKDCDIRVREGEKVHCFCSYDCREKYLKQIQGEEPSQELPKDET
jgi:YHS domain-containing protein